MIFARFHDHMIYGIFLPFCKGPFLDLFKFHLTIEIISNQGTIPSCYLKKVVF